MWPIKRKQPDTPESRAVQTIADFANGATGDLSEESSATQDRMFALYAYMFGAILALSRKEGMALAPGPRHRSRVLHSARKAGHGGRRRHGSVLHR